MSIAAADLHTAIATAWNAAGLDATFKALWPDPDSEDYDVLYDQEAAPAQPFPYCVVDQAVSKTVTRMSSGDDSHKLEIRDTPLKLNIHARDVEGDSRSAKAIAANLAEEVMKTFGGHPTEQPAALELANGKALCLQFVADYGVRTHYDRYQWVLSYIVRADVPVTI